MLEAVFISLVAGLFVYQIAFFRKLTNKQVNQTLKTLITDYEHTSKQEKVVSVPSQPIAIQESIKK